MRKKVGFYLLIAFLFACLVGTSVFSTYESFVGEGPLPQRKEVMINKGMPLRQIATYLHTQGVIDSPSIFVLGVRANRKATDIKAGEYSIPARASAKMVMDILTGGQTFIRRICVPEGLTSYQIVQLLDKTEGLTGSVEQIPANGTLLPQTYYFSYGDTKEQIITRMQNEMRRTLDELMQTRDEKMKNFTAKEIVTLASMVEKETSVPAERAHVASVFINRLDKKMRLQSDPTVIYALSNGTGIYKKKLWSNDLKKPHPYNTYYINGLPPGAIANPGREAIEAVLHPLSTPDLYFVADGTGGHSFSDNYKDHQAKVNEWRQIRDNPALRKQKAQENKQRSVLQRISVSAKPVPNAGAEDLAEDDATADLDVNSGANTDSNSDTAALPDSTSENG